MKLLSIRQFIILILLFSCSLPTLARDYIIDVIIFANNHGKFQVSNQLATFNKVEPPTNGVDLLAQKTASSSAGTWSLLGNDSSFLAGPAKQIRSSGNYTVLEHLTWIQPAVSKQQALAIQIQAGKDYSAQFPRHHIRQTEFGDGMQSTIHSNRKSYELDGTIKVSVSRYIHIYTDMVYRLPGKNPDTGESILIDYPIQSHRRMRSKDLHYIDHPLVGILVEARSAN